MSPSILDEGFTVLVVYDETGWIVLAFDHLLGGLGVWKNDALTRKGLMKRSLTISFL